MLLTGNLGKLVTVTTNKVPPSLLPPAAVGMKGQIPSPARGKKIPDTVQQRQEDQREGRNELEFFPSFQPRLAPYLAAQDEYGNTALKPNPLISAVPLDAPVQQGKYWLSEYGLRYSLQQTFNVVAMSDVMQGDKVLGYYTFDWAAKWAVFSSTDSGTAGWISAQIEAQVGLGAPSQTQSPRENIGSLTKPMGIWSSQNGFRIPELAWQQSFLNGDAVAVAGMVNQVNYLDVNTYANSGRSQFMNSALINSMVLPLTGYNPGVNLQWQPTDAWYAMVGSSVGNSKPGNTPWSDFTWSYWSVIAEFGWTPNDLLGLGPGVYRVQPFVAEAGGPTQGGLCFNFQQQLGEHSPFVYFGRFGFGGSQVTRGASAQVGTGFGVIDPLDHAGFSLHRGNDAVGFGFVWSQPSAGSTPVVHNNEYAFEAVYVLQLTHLAKLQPDIQIIWNPAYNPDPGPAVVFQLQLAMSW